MVKMLPVMLFVSLFSTRKFDDKKCKLPTSGIYEVVYDKAFASHSPFTLRLDDGCCWIIYGQDSAKYEIRNIDKCEWDFQSKAEVDTSRLSDIHKVLYSVGTSYYRVTMINKRKLRFVLHRNPHIIINSGCFYRQF